jgi:hypothetical protein
MYCSCYSNIRGATVPEDVTRQEAYRVCSEQLRAWRRRRRVEGDAKLACLPAADAGRSLPDTSALVNWSILHLI